ncbi:hypothetical protein [Paludisphaera rhizosphaerae]|uniref:hypothetical protein n=1 Tax=Paludisphaera rhizosphaerae TaxID=2711216 RepID=UPI0013EE2598|nr:hypothetical protein [Paludisphaera rhizosphaerae]
MSDRLDADDVHALLASLGPQGDAHILRAFSAVCCRRIWEHLTAESRAAVGIVEAWLAGLTTDEDLVRASQSAADAVATAERRLDIHIARNGHLFHAALAAAACAWLPETKFELITTGRGRVIKDSLEAAALCASQSATGHAIAGFQHLTPVEAMHAAVETAWIAESAEQAAILRTLLEGQGNHPGDEA